MGVRGHERRHPGGEGAAVAIWLPNTTNERFRGVLRYGSYFDSSNCTSLLYNIRGRVSPPDFGYKSIRYTEAQVPTNLILFWRIYGQNYFSS